MILIKFPTRSRPKKFLSQLEKLRDLAEFPNKLALTVSYDLDDVTMTDEVIAQAKKIFPNGNFMRGVSASKIHACNRDINLFTNWEILILMSDDMIPIKKNWDSQMIKEMRLHYPNTDGVLFHNDGYCKDKLNTMCILGRKYFERFNYIYHPEYRSLWCDNEFGLVANLLGKQTYFDEVLFKHEHPANVPGITNDHLYVQNEKLYSVDKETFEKRRSINFGL